MKKRKLMIICLAAVLVLSLAGSYAEATEADLPVLKIGTALPFTGFVAESAKEMEEVFLMYVDQNGGKLGGLPVEVIFEDTETQAEMVVTKTKKLIANDQVHLLSGGMLAFEGLAMVDAVNKAQIALVGWTGVCNDEFSRLKSPYVSGAAKHTPSAETMPFGEYAYKVLGYRKMAILGQDYAWGWQTTGGFHFTFERAGGKIVQKLWAPIGTADYAPFVTQIRRDVDAVYSTLVGADVPRFVKAYRDFGLKGQIPLLGSEDFVAEDAIRYYGDEAVGIIGITPYPATNFERPEFQKFVEAYRKLSGKNPTFWGEAAYVAAMAIDRALLRLREEGVPTNELPKLVREDAVRFISTIRALDLSDAPASPVRVDDYNWGIRNFYLVELVKKDGKVSDQVIHTFPDVSQFWTLEPEEFLKNPVFSREFPPVTHR
jgi:branched-chain amino acid transport system substrate-binding protein